MVAKKKNAGPNGWSTDLIMKKWTQYAPLIGIYTLLMVVATPLRSTLESTMTGHVLVELPLLALSGFLIAIPFRQKYADTLSLINRGGIPGILIVSFTLVFWMIPKWLDYSLSSNLVDFMKVFSMVFLVGSVLSFSLPKTSGLILALFKIECLTMLLRLGWIYLISPERLCNNYLLNDQKILGNNLLILAGALAILWIYPLFVESKNGTRYS